MPAGVAALIPAAGMGERLGMGPKAFVRVAGQTLLERALACFAGLVDEVVVALPESHFDAPLPASVRRVLGGASRQQSVENMLQATSSELVLIHDAARPFLPRAVVEATLKAVREVGAATVALPAADTLVLEETTGRWGGPLERSKIHAVQTPQGFRKDLIVEAHAKAKLAGITATDDAGLVARLGFPVALVTGDPLLFKVTRPGDCALAEAFAPIWDQQFKVGS